MAKVKALEITSANPHLRKDRVEELARLGAVSVPTSGSVDARRDAIEQEFEKVELQRQDYEQEREELKAFAKESASDKQFNPSKAKQQTEIQYKTQQLSVLHGKEEKLERLEKDVDLQELYSRGEETTLGSETSESRSKASEVVTKKKSKLNPFSRSKKDPQTKSDSKTKTKRKLFSRK